MKNPGVPLKIRNSIVDTKIKHVNPNHTNTSHNKMDDGNVTMKIKLEAP